MPKYAAGDRKLSEWKAEGTCFEPQLLRAARGGIYSSRADSF
jgi:hypothetical protein